MYETSVVHAVNNTDRNERLDKLDLGGLEIANEHEAASSCARIPDVGITAKTAMPSGRRSNDFYATVKRVGEFNGLHRHGTQPHRRQVEQTNINMP